MPLNIKNYSPAAMAGANFGVAAGTAVQITNVGTTVAFIGDLAVATVASTSTGTAVANGQRGLVTTRPLFITSATAHTLNISNTSVTPDNLVFANILGGTNTTGFAHIGTVTPGSGSVLIEIVSSGTTGIAALDGTLKVAFLVA